jgi:DNA-binding response OmpR family regulator
MTSKARILIVDDERSVRTAIELALESSNVDVVTADSAEAALTIVAQSTFDLLLIDKNLPGMSGIDLVRKLREDNNPTWCVMITGFASSASAIETLNLGIRAYVEKPFDDIFKVVRQIEGLLGMKRTQEKLAQSTERLRVLGQSLQQSRQIKILLASADPAETEWIKKVLTVRHSDLIQTVTTAAATIEKLRAETPQLLIVDINLTHPDFIQFIQEISAVTPATAVAVLVSEKPFVKSMTQLIDAGVKSVIQRPLNEVMFRSRMDALFLRIRELDPMTSGTPVP